MPSWRSWTVGTSVLTASVVLWLSASDSEVEAREHVRPTVAENHAGRATQNLLSRELLARLAAASSARSAANPLSTPAAATSPSAAPLRAASPSVPAAEAPDKPPDLPPDVSDSGLQQAQREAPGADVVAAWDAEQPNLKATREHKAYLEDALSDLDLRAEIHSVECRTSLCRVNMGFSNVEDALAFDADGAKREQRRHLRVELQDGGVNVDVFIALESSASMMPTRGIGRGANQ